MSLGRMAMPSAQRAETPVHNAAKTNAFASTNQLLTEHSLGRLNPKSKNRNRHTAHSECSLPAVAGTPRSKQLLDRMLAKIHQWERPALWPWQIDFRIQSQAMEDRRHNLGRLDRPFGGHARNRIAASNDSSALHATAGEINRPALWPVISPTGRIDA